MGVIVHHVASMYPLEIQLALLLAEGKPITGVTWDDVHVVNATHAAEDNDVTKRVACEPLLRYSEAAADAIRKLSN